MSEIKPKVFKVLYHLYSVNQHERNYGKRFSFLPLLLLYSIVFCLAFLHCLYKYSNSNAVRKTTYPMVAMVFLVPSEKTMVTYVKEVILITNFLLKIICNFCK